MLTRTQKAKPIPRPRTYEFKESRPRPRAFLIKDKVKTTHKLKYEFNDSCYEIVQ